jgi:hypothetical protein
MVVGHELASRPTARRLQRERPDLFTPWLRAGAGIGLLAVLVVGSSLQRRINDPDVWWHLKTGAIIAATGQVPRTDPFSYSAGGKPWTAHEWLSELLLYGVWRGGGFAALLWYRSLLLAALAAVVFFVVRRRCGSFIVALLATLGVMLATASFWGERPHLFSYLFFAGLLAALDLAQVGRPALLWALPPVMVLWANLHGGFFAAFLLLGATLAGALVDRWFDSHPARGPDDGPGPAGDGDRSGGAAPGPPSAALVRTLLLVLLASLAAACLNPQGPAILLYPLRYLLERGLATYINEWQPPDVREPLGRLLETLLLGSILLGVVTARRWAWRDLLPLLLFAHLALTAVRHVPLFALVAVNFLAGAWPDCWRQATVAVRRSPTGRRVWEAIARGREQPGAGEETLGTRAMALALAAGGIALCLSKAPRSSDLGGTVRLNEIPVAAGKWIQANVPPGRIFNHYDYGGYLIYLPRSGQRVEPGPNPWRVVIDGREDVYGGRMMREFYEQAFQAGPRWRELLDGRYRADWVAWPQAAPLTRVLQNASEWQQVYPPPGSSDRQVAIFRRTGRQGG